MSIAGPRGRMPALVDNRSKCCDSNPVNGKQFTKAAKIWANSRGLSFSVEASRGEGGHQILRVGDKWTTVQTGELKRGVFHAMLKQLGIPKEEF